MSAARDGTPLPMTASRRPSSGGPPSSSTGSTWPATRSCSTPAAAAARSRSSSSGASRAGGCTRSTRHRRWSLTPRPAVGDRATALCQDLAALELPEPVDVVFSKRHLPLDPRSRCAVRRAAPQHEAGRTPAGPMRRQGQHRRVPADLRRRRRRGAVRAVLHRLDPAVELCDRRGDRDPPGAGRLRGCVDVARGPAHRAGRAAELRRDRLPGPPPRPAPAGPARTGSSTRCSSGWASRSCSTTFGST